MGIAYETIQLPDGSLPLLTPMSEVAGWMAIQQGDKYLERALGGRGGVVLLINPSRRTLSTGGCLAGNDTKDCRGSNHIILNPPVEQGEQWYRRFLRPIGCE